MVEHRIKSLHPSTRLSINDSRVTLIFGVVTALALLSVFIPQVRHAFPLAIYSLDVRGVFSRLFRLDLPRYSRLYKSEAP